MKAEIIAVGTELLLGQIVNTNAQYLAQKCAEIGIDIYFQTVAGDNESRLLQALDIARNRADLVLCTGGLGPTQDDLTKDVLGRFLGRELVMHQPSLDSIAAFFQARGVKMVESNARQALILEGSTPLANDTGLAVGVAVTQDGTHYVLLPGPPKEMKPMFETYAADWLRSVMTDEIPLFSRMLKFSGIGESGLEHRLLDLIESQQDPTIAPYAKEGEVTIRLTTRAGNEEEANRKIAPTEQAIRDRLGDYLYAQEDVGIERVVVSLLLEKKVTLSAAESCTGGLLGDLITSVPGSSKAFLGGVISYSNELKQALLGVPKDVLEGPGAPGAVSEETARIMAENMLERAGTDLAVSLTGVAGPDTSEGKPVGLVYIGIAAKGQPARAIETRHSGNRELIKLKAAKAALHQIWRILDKEGEGGLSS